MKKRSSFTGTLDQKKGLTRKSCGKGFHVGSLLFAPLSLRRVLRVNFRSFPPSRFILAATCSLDARTLGCSTSSVRPLPVLGCLLCLSRSLDPRLKAPAARGLCRPLLWGPACAGSAASPPGDLALDARPWYLDFVNRSFVVKSAGLQSPKSHQQSAICGLRPSTFDFRLSRQSNYD
jgi:hypothetical protein